NGGLVQSQFVSDLAQHERAHRHLAVREESSLALDNGQVLGLGSLGLVLSGDTGAFGWQLKRMLPPYCQATNCGVGPIIESATSARL
ncbi:MAG TPA: hypothetical protein PLO33_10980, partial [Kouleothrix sp.]|nr:hypothetical protein [Kouleothrix sp.]